jgi:hypothetical protein
MIPDAAPGESVGTLLGNGVLKLPVRREPLPVPGIPWSTKKPGETMAGEDYRRYAADCLKLADLITDQTSKAALHTMAAAWVRLAEQAERNSQTFLVYEPPYFTERAKP